MSVPKSIIVLAAGGLITVGLIAVSRLAAGDSPLERISAEGASAELSPRGREQLESYGGSSASLLGTRDGRAFLRFDGRGGSICYSVTDDAPALELGFVHCAVPAAFPTPAEPVIGFIQRELAVRGSGSGTIYRVVGFAADAVAEVEFERYDGVVMAETRAVDNIFSLRVVGPYVVGGHVVARDARGDVVYRRKYEAAA